MEKPINDYIEHTLLKTTCTQNQIEQLVKEAISSNFVGVCVPPFWVKSAKRFLGEAPVQLVTVIGFPLGYQMTESKLLEAQRAIDNGADELDLVWNNSAYKSGMNWPKIEVAKMAKLCHDHGRLLKVIIETAYLAKAEIVDVASQVVDAGADFVKTSTGFAPTGAVLSDVELIKETINDRAGIKASGGIKTRAQAEAFIAAGAERLGTSSGIEICA